MIFVIGEHGRRGNEFFFSANCLASALEYKQNICFLNLSDYSDEYIFNVSKEIIKGTFFLHPPIVLKKCIKTLNRVFSKIKYTLSDEEIRKKISKGKNVIIYKWPYLDDDGMNHQRETIRDFFSLNPPKKEQLDIEFAKIVRGYDVVVAVHMRGTDYRCWNDGIYYFSQETYLKWCEEIVSEIPDNKKVLMLLFSDDYINVDCFQQKFDVVCPNGDASSDLYMMSLCDYLLCTHSTFAYWAEFMGEVKMTIMSHDYETVKDAGFIYLDD